MGVKTTAIFPTYKENGYKVNKEFGTKELKVDKIIFFGYHIKCKGFKI